MSVILIVVAFIVMVVSSNIIDFLPVRLTYSCTTLTRREIGANILILQFVFLSSFHRLMRLMQ